jgi:hypothetical protein
VSVDEVAHVAVAVETMEQKPYPHQPRLRPLSRRRRKPNKQGLKTTGFIEGRLRDIRYGATSALTEARRTTSIFSPSNAP